MELQEEIGCAEPVVLAWYPLADTSRRCLVEFHLIYSLSPRISRDALPLALDESDPTSN